MSETNKHPKADSFRLSLTDDITHRRIWEYRFNRTTFLVLIISLVVVLLGGSFALIAFTPIRTAIPGYPDASTRMEAVQNAITIDSLERVITRWEFYTDNLVSVLEGEEPIPVDSLLKLAEANENALAEPGYLAARDSALREIVDKSEQFRISDNQERRIPIEGMQFFLPLKGVIITPYDEILHPSIDISSTSGTVVMAVLPGTVIYDGWSDTEGYTIAIQHNDDIVSIYKNNQKLLKKRGDKVGAGTSIAIVGNSGDPSDHLHFELWYNGSAVDPSAYINF